MSQRKWDVRRRLRAARHKLSLSTFNIQVLHTPDPGISPEVDEGVDAGVAHGYQQEHGVDVAEYVTGNKQIQIR